MPGGQFLELLLLKWSDFDNSKIAAGYFTHNYGLDPHNRFMKKFQDKAIYIYESKNHQTTYLVTTDNLTPLPESRKINASCHHLNFPIKCLTKKNYRFLLVFSFLEINPYDSSLNLVVSP